MARPPKLTPRSQDAICAVIRAGGYLQTAAASAGVDKRNLLRWMARGREDEAAGLSNRYTQFLASVREAEAHFETRATAQITSASRDIRDPETQRIVHRGDWKAAAWMLERRHPKRWAQRIRVTIDQELNDLLNVAEGVLSETDYERLLVALAARDKEDDSDGLGSTEDPG